MNPSGDIDVFGLLRKNSDHVVVAVIVIFSLVLSKNVYQKQTSKYQALKDKITSEQERGAILDRIVAAHEKVKKFKTKGWEAMDANVIIEKISAVGLKLRLKIRDITPLEKRDTKHYVLIPFSMNFDATYRDFYRFVKALETYPQLIHVTSAVLTPISTEDPFHVAPADMLLRVGFSIEAVYVK